jgi:hypothetical protein
MLRCPACNAGLPVDGKSAVVTCMYCNARVEIDRRGQAQVPAPTVHAAPPQRSMAWMSWLTVPIVLLFSGGMATYQWYRAQSLVTTPVTAPVATPIATPKSTMTPQHVTTVSEASASPPARVESPEPELETPASPPTSAPAKAPRADPTPAPTGPVISVDEARKQLEPAARACMKQAKVHHLLAYMGNTKVGPVKVLPDPRTHTDGTKVALAKTALGRCLDEAGAKVRVSALKSNYVRLDVRNDDVVNPLAELPKTFDRNAVRDVITGFDEQVKACARKHGKEGSRESFRFTIAGPTGKVVSVNATYLEGPFRACALALYKGAVFPKVQSATYSITYPIDL